MIRKAEFSFSVIPKTEDEETGVVAARWGNVLLLQGFYGL
jgi:hypothetical protein